MKMLKDKVGDTALIALVGNKIDLEKRQIKLKLRVVTLNQGMDKAKEHNAIFMEVSAKAGTNIKELFRDLTKHLTQDDYSPPTHAATKDHGGSK